MTMRNGMDSESIRRDGLPRPSSRGPDPRSSSVSDAEGE